jgi:hypothetical protein
MFAERFLTELGLKLDYEYKYNPDCDDNTLGVDALRSLYNSVIVEYCRGVNQVSNFNLDLPNPVNLLRSFPDDHWGLYRDPDKNRTWVKRYADYIRDLSGLKLGSDLMGKIGEAAARLKGSGGDAWCFDFHLGADWSPGDFGEYFNSCWWNKTQYNWGRLQASSEGLACIRFYDPARGRGDGSKGVGRAWLWADSMDYINLFNFYWGGDKNYRIEGALKMLIPFLSNASGRSFSWLKRGFESVDDVLWVNNNEGYVLHTGDVPIRDWGYIELDTSEACRCSRCDVWADIDGGAFDSYDNFYCEHCVSSGYVVQCAVCGQFYHDDDDLMRLPGGDGLICRDCLYSSDDYIQCASCGDLVYSDDVVYDDGDNAYCGSCAMRYLSECSECGAMFHRGAGGSRSDFESGLGLCPDCRDALYVQCRACDKWILRDSDDYKIIGLTRIIPQYRRDSVVVFEDYTFCNECLKSGHGDYTFKVADCGHVVINDDAMMDSGLCGFCDSSHGLGVVNRVNDDDFDKIQLLNSDYSLREVL